jgi:NADH-quinone oxidoreductase subunit A
LGAIFDILLCINTIILRGFSLSHINISRGLTPLLENYFPILVFIAIGGLMGIVLIWAGWVIGPNKPNADKNSAYECGFDAFDDARMKFDIRYYLVAILFIIFDLEIAFLFPWAVVLDSIDGVGYLAMALFLAILVIGFIYEWKKGALEWE